MFPDDRRQHTKTKSFSTTHTENKSIDPLTEYNFRSAHKNRVNFNPRKKTKSISIPILKSSHFRPSHKNQVNFALDTEIKSFSIPT